MYFFSSFLKNFSLHLQQILFERRHASVFMQVMTDEQQHDVFTCFQSITPTNSLLIHSVITAQFTCTVAQHNSRFFAFFRSSERQTRAVFDATFWVDSCTKCQRTKVYLLQTIVSRYCGKSPDLRASHKTQKQTWKSKHWKLCQSTGTTAWKCKFEGTSLFVQHLGMFQTEAIQIRIAL